MSKRSSRPKAKFRHSLSFQRLEERTVPAGAVSALVSEGVLYVAGDNAANSLWVAVTGRDTVTVYPHDGSTAVNGAAAPVTFNGVSRGIYAQLAGGDDFLVLVGARGNTSVHIDTGDGNDAVALAYCTNRRSTGILTGAGDDRVSIGGSDLGGYTYVGTGAGNDTANLGWSQYHRLQVEGGSGINSLTAPDVKTRYPALVTGFTVSSSPTALPDTASVAGGSTVRINVAANDVPGQGTLDLDSVVVVSAPTRGTAVANDDGTVTYTSTQNTSGTDTFQYTIRNSAGDVSVSGTVTVTIAATPDTTAPTVNLTTSATSPSKLSSLAFTAAFSEDVTGFAASGISVTGGTVGGFTRTNARSYNFNVTPTADGSVVVRVNAAVAFDGANNGNKASNTVTIVSDRTAPTVASNALTTNDTTPTLTGTVNDSTAAVSVTVAGQTLTASVTGTTWSVTAAAVVEGTYPINVTATDKAGNVGTSSLPGGLVVNLSVPAVTANAVTTKAANPVLTGTADDPAATVSVIVAGQTLTAVVTGTTWSATATAVAEGTYTISVTATDTAGNVGSANLNNGLVVDRTAPTATANALTTNAADVVLTGTINEPTATVTVTVAGQTLTASVTGTTWSATASGVAEGTYDIDVTAIDAAGNSDSTSFIGGLIVDRTDPTVAVNSVATNAADPVLTGTVDESTATVVVTVAGQTLTAAVSGTTWTVTAPGVAEGTFDVGVTATDAAGNVGSANLTGGLVVDRTNPTVAVDLTGSGAITGTSSDGASGVAGVELSIFDGTNYWNGSAFASTVEVFLPATTSDNFATWSLGFGTPGTYTVHARATDAGGNTADDTESVTLT